MIRLDALKGALKPRFQPAVRFDREARASRQVPWSYFVTPEIFTTCNNELAAVIQVAGVPFEVQDYAALNQLQQQLSFQLHQLGDGYAVVQTTHRRREACAQGGDCPAGFAADFARAYQRQFAGAELYVNDLYLTIVQKAGSTRAKKGMAWLERLGARQDTAQYAKWKAARLRHFETKLAQLIAGLQPFSPQLLGARETAEGAPEARPLGLLSALVNGRLQPYGYPYRDIASFVPQARPYFGRDALHLEYPAKGHDVFAAMLSIKHYCASTTPGHLNNLLALPTECLVTHSFLGLDSAQAVKLIERQLKRLGATNDAAVSQMQELGQAMDDLASGKITFGLHHNSAMVLSEDLDSLEDKVALAVKAYADRRIHAVRETENLQQAFWAQVPGNARFCHRQAPISNHNFSCLAPLHNYPTGYHGQNHLGGALMLAETQGRAPLYLNLHQRASGRKDDLPAGHTVLIGPTNAGKTVLMATVNTMMQQYGITGIFFDRNNGAENYVRAMGGTYCALLPGEATGWNPCQLPDTLQNRAFLRDFLEALCGDARAPLSAADIGRLHDAVDRLYTLPKEKRRLSVLHSFFPRDFAGLPAFSRYCRLPGAQGLGGDLAYLFDNAEDTLDLQAKTLGFDMTHWFSEAGEPSVALLPLTLYLMHRVQGLLDGRLVGLYMDEGWQVLQQPYWRAKLEEFLVTWRKANAFVFFATQLATKVAASGLGAALIQNTATHIFLGNPEADEASYCGAFGLTARELAIVRSLDKSSRFFLFKQGAERAIARIKLGHLPRYLSVLSTNAAARQQIEALRHEHGDAPEKWLPHFYALGGHANEK